MAGSERGRGPLWRVRRRWARMGLLARIVVIALGLLIAFIALGGVLEACGATKDEPEEPPVTSNSVDTSPPASPDVYYENCDEARAAGAAPVFAGDPGYGPHLDRDGDGVACEP